MTITIEHESAEEMAARNGFSATQERLTAPLRILIADDQEDVRHTVVLILDDEFDIVGTAENGLRAVELATQLSPDVVILDISMPVLNGIEAACCLKQRHSPARIIFLTIYADPDMVEAALCTGAVGYVAKASLATDLTQAIWAAMNDNVFVSPSIQ